MYSLWERNSISEVGIEAEGCTEEFQSLSAHGRIYKGDVCGKSFVKVDNEFLDTKIQWLARYLVDPTHPDMVSVQEMRISLTYPRLKGCEWFYMAFRKSIFIRFRSSLAVWMMSSTNWKMIIRPFLNICAKGPDPCSYRPTFE
jgi:hypothetical protein